jgi:hypothetical protein
VDHHVEHGCRVSGQLHGTLEGNLRTANAGDLCSRGIVGRDNDAIDDR